MSKRLFGLFTLLIIFAMLTAACSSSTPAPEAPKATEAPEEATEAPEEATEAPEEETEEAMAEDMAHRYGQVTDVGGIDDKGFNQLAWKGMQDAVSEIGAEAQFLESQQQTDYEKNINEFINQGYDGIITVGFLLGDATKAASEANPDVPFAIVDFPSQTSGDMGLLFNVDEPSFQAGYLAAGMSETGTVCTYGGIKIPPVVAFMVGFEYGVNYYNEQKGTSVQLLGWKTDAASEGGGDGSFTGNFESLDDGRSFAENFFDEGCDIIFPVAGPVGLGSAAAAQDRGYLMIGVDADLTQTASEFEEVFLTSVLKKIDVAVAEAVRRMDDGSFEGGTNYFSTTANGGVGLASFYDHDGDVSQELKDELAAIEQGLVAGDISTGWPVGADEAMADEGEAMSDVSIVMSFVPSGDTEEIIASGDALAAMIAERTGYDVSSNVATSYAAVIEAMGAGNAQVGWLNTFGYILAHEKYEADVALATVRFGTTFYKGQIITRNDSGIEAVEDLAGKTFCRPDVLSTSGWIIPSITLAAAGLDPAKDIEVTDVGSHNNVVTAVYNEECDAGATFVDARGSVEDDLADVKEVVIVIAESADIPNDTVSFASDVPEDVRANIVSALLDIAGTEEGVAALEELYSIAGLEEVDDTFYDGFRIDLDASGFSIEDFQPTAEAAGGDATIVMSFVPSGDTEEIIASGDALAAMIAERTGYDVSANVATSYAAVIEAMGAGNAQVGWLNTFGYILAHEKYGADVGLATVRFGTTTYKGQIITRNDSGITSVEDLAGKTFCRPDVLSTSGWIIPSITLAAAGLDPENDIEVTDVGSHNNVVSAVYNGECDAGATFVDARGSVEDDIPDVKDVVIVITESADIPNDTVSFAPDVPEDVRANIVSALLDIASTEEGVAALEELYSIAGLEEVDDTFYDGFRVDLDASGFNIEDFQ